MFLPYLGVFLGLGLSGLIPTMHFTIAEGFVKATTVGQMGWFYLMGAMYISGATLYAARIPERYFPGKCDIWVRIFVACSIVKWPKKLVSHGFCLFSVSVSSDIPCAGGRGGVCPFLWDLKPAGVSLWSGRRLHR